MESPELSFTLAYIVFCLCFVFTPNEFRSAGLTIQNLFSSWLGSEDVAFVQFHIRRTSVTVLVHSALPLGYYIGMCFAAPEKKLGYFHQVNDSWRAFFLLSICLQLTSWTIVIYWSQHHWHNHPISRALQAHERPPYSDWNVASSINTEFRRIDKFATGAPGSRVIVTDSWVLKWVTNMIHHLALSSQDEKAESYTKKSFRCDRQPLDKVWTLDSAHIIQRSCLKTARFSSMFDRVKGVHCWSERRAVTTYHVYMALQNECHVTVTESRQHQLSPDSSSPAQILTLRVDSINPAIRHFDIRLNSTEYAELREKLHAPIRNSANVVIHQTISELFLETFRAQVDLNEPYTLPIGQEIEPCIGCMQVPANTKLVRLCQTEGPFNESDCQLCMCRPMWCLSCLGRWFASRQDQQRPETWLSSKVPCPTCRAKFCILDVSVLH